MNIKSFAVAILAAGLVHASCQTINEPTDREVALAGTLREVHGFGPPGYGEDKKTDAKIVYWALDLPVSIDVACPPESRQWASTDCQSVKRLRLFLPVGPNGSDLRDHTRKLVGRKALVTGVLHRRDTMGEITPIYMDVTQISPVALK